MPVASLFVSSCWFFFSKVLRGEWSRGHHVIFDLFPCTISLSLYIPFTLVSCVNRLMTNQTSTNHINYIILVLPPNRAAPPRLLAVADGRTARKQRSASRSRALSVRDDEEGHLICRSGDVLQERCTHCHYSIVTISEYSIYMTWECLMMMMTKNRARKVLALAQIVRADLQERCN